MHCIKNKYKISTKFTGIKLGLLHVDVLKSKQIATKTKLDEKHKRLSTKQTCCQSTWVFILQCILTVSVLSPGCFKAVNGKLCFFLVF